MLMFYLIFKQVEKSNELIKFINMGVNVRFYRSYDIELTLKSLFLALFLSLCTQRCYAYASILTFLKNQSGQSFRWV